MGEIHSGGEDPQWNVVLSGHKKRRKKNNNKNKKNIKSIKISGNDKFQGTCL